MEISIAGALVGGFVGTLVMLVMMKMAGAAGIADMPPMELVTGAMVSGDESQARRIGIVIHWIAMGTIAFGLGYAALMSLLGSSAWPLGVGLGHAHGAVVGLVFMPMMPAMHPRMSREPAAPRSARRGARSICQPPVCSARGGGA